MAGQLREYRRRIRSVQSTKKITRAMELIAASRIAKARARVAAARPYAEEITRVIEAVAAQTTIDHPLTTERPGAARAAVVVITSDRGLAGGYSSNALRRTGELIELLHSEGKETDLHVVGRKGTGYYRFRGRAMSGEYTGFSEQPSYADAKSVADALIAAFIATSENGGVDEIHVVHTEYVSAITQTPVARRLLPMVLTETDEPPRGGPLPQYEFEPSAEGVLDALLPRYVESRLYAALLESAASESAARQRAMKSATDNAEDLIKRYTRQANRARQDAITQEISEIVGGANALASGT
ncbi:F0F1 ATP synthase subunit gamma [Frankia sp. CcI156]|uniref:ATP synthase gamma chain n=1 Tax=Frankia casuarinae (strain DSM 45818 / CECT 9043 / HFP020203 / CcI3) TaxID=106370 RepID=ATPG_FRACC|nr:MULTISPECIES: F0F1 ATP synthase subunit gamma [Frankia]Q2J6N2.1 RecName: Full=ATP synthase gamma chain; AltName: Full=ATP synthase F1 sector gamma subunit; AltName: Full=F-ATPase gamma subunit [Frankia casuarinae]ABD13060.1 ATP synthase F1 subcomplex gamma subunit [Frankia casuarinae]ETA01760.1 ATP synthase F1 subcomplex gamma subunit [Frankia sp. CcI6]OAA23942.1 ATP synthase F1 subcomplex gamma subunit [Frankia casuarinae]OHV53599.1 F0F1 ATP synthase subunit gamma [Frankia sp. CgIS1]ONH25